jgi:aminoglycoside phosphotransferase (APT) family kinase protein
MSSTLAPVAYTGGGSALESEPTPEGVLLDVLRQRAKAPGLRFASSPERIGGGFWAEILAVHIEGGPTDLNGDVVVRIMPEARIARRETAVQEEVVRQGFPAPRVLLSGEADDGLGRAFMVMERVQGRPPLPEVMGTTALAAIGRAAIRLPDLLARTAARLHALDPGPLRSKLEGVDGALVDVGDLLALLAERASEAQRPDLAAAAQHMLSTRPPSEREAICHGDLHPFNILVDDDGQITVVDWTVALMADPAFDLGFTAMIMALAPIAIPRPLRRPVRAASRWGSREFLRRYRHHAPANESSLTDDVLAWYTAVHGLRALVEVSDWIAAGIVDDKAGHPWLAMAPQLAVLVGKVADADIRPM